jgi:peptidoglycan/xylan/chitin deacetylase (PgdA/CDA1 family)
MEDSMRIVMAFAFVLAAISLAAFGAVRAPNDLMTWLLTKPASLWQAQAPQAETAPSAAMPPAQVAVASPVAAVADAAPASAAATATTTGQGTSPRVAATPTLPAPAAPPPPIRTCANPDAIEVSRTVEIDTTGGPGFGFEHFKEYDFLKPNEVVLTFDDGPWPGNTPAVLAALADNCIKAVFFPIGKHAMWHPEILRQVAEAGHTIGSHTWSHADLSKKSAQDAKDEIEKGVSAIRFALGAPEAPFFRFPDLRHPPEMVTYLGQRNIAIFSCDLDSFDFKLRKPEQVIKSVMTKLKKNGKGIVLLHDFQHATAMALPELLKQLKANGYKIVQVKAKQPVQTIASYDEEILKEQALPTVTTRPTSEVVKTISQ